MAIIRIDHKPESLGVITPLQLIIPEPGDMRGVPVRDRKVLYLLHGLSEDAGAWQRYTMIEVFAQERGLIVVMPSGARSFYIDRRDGQKYFTYLTEELPTYLSAVFGIEAKRERTLIAGSSMGGYGAFKAALTCPERYAAACSLSGVLSAGILQGLSADPRRAEFELLFGGLERLAGGEHDPLVWLRNAAEKRNAGETTLPELTVCCGKQDELYPLSLAFREACARLDVPLTYHESDGAHDWRYWNREIEWFLKTTLDESHD